MRAIASLWILSLLVSALLMTSSRASRRKRNLYQLSRMLECLTGKWFSYIGYGCFCGAGNRGGEPVDELDECCMKHDICYNKLRRNECAEINRAKFLPPAYVATYNYDCHSETNDVRCRDEADTCSYAACRCDRKFAQCAHSANFHEEFTRRRMDYKLCPELDEAMQNAFENEEEADDTSADAEDDDGKE